MKLAMTLKRIVAVALLALMALPTRAEEIKFTSAENLPLYGKADTNTWKRYTRLPGCLEGKVRPAVWSLGTNSAGWTAHISPISE